MGKTLEHPVTKTQDPSMPLVRCSSMRSHQRPPRNMASACSSSKGSRRDKDLSSHIQYNNNSSSNNSNIEINNRCSFNNSNNNNSCINSSFKDIPSSSNIFHIISTHNTNNSSSRATTTSFSPKLTQLWLRDLCLPSTTVQVGMVVVVEEEEEDNKSKYKLL